MDGLMKGIIKGVARAQIRHDDAFGLLPNKISDDKEMVLIVDPASNWSIND